jgi:acetyltransferase-like isoleucine patch superfamily enzyme
MPTYPLPDSWPFAPNPYNPLCWVIGVPDVGPGCWIGAFTMLDGSGGLRVGRGCELSSGVQILTHSSMRRCVTEREFPDVDRAATELGDWVFVGTGATVLMGSRIGHHSVIAAGAVVEEFSEFPPFSLIAGVPARWKGQVDPAALAGRPHPRQRKWLGPAGGGPCGEDQEPLP